MQPESSLPVAAATASARHCHLLRALSYVLAGLEVSVVSQLYLVCRNAPPSLHKKEGLRDDSFEVLLTAKTVDQ